MFNPLIHSLNSCFKRDKAHSYLFLKILFVPSLIKILFLEALSPLMLEILLCSYSESEVKSKIVDGTLIAGVGTSSIKRIIVRISAALTGSANA